MQSDRRLVEHVQHAAQLRSDLRRQPDALSFAAAQRHRRAVQRDVAQADRVQEFQPLGDLAPDASRNLLLALVQLDAGAPPPPRATPAAP